MKTARWFSIALILFVPVLLFSQLPDLSMAPGAPVGVPTLSVEQQQKVASGRLLIHLAQKYSQARTMGKSPSQTSITVAVYAAEYPSRQFIGDLEQRGVTVLAGSWIPAIDNHPLGFFLAQIPVDRLADVLTLDAVKKLDAAEAQSIPLNNNAARLIGADLAWTAGWTGSGVTVGVLDSGLDISFAGTELPSGITTMDYSNYPTLDNTVTNLVKGHGTHVTGSILSRGYYSTGNTANGGGAYKGMAPNANLVFLKIGNDYNAGATDAAEIAAIQAAASTYHVNVLNLSYGGWDAFHDGSNGVSQAIDYAYSQGVSCIVAAGNLGNAKRHYSGIAPAVGWSDYIQVTVTDPGASTELSFNLVWGDGSARKNMSLYYYDGNKNPITSVYRYGTSESARGTESQYSYDWNYLPNASATYYLRVYNPSASAQPFHVYEDFNNTHVTFANADPEYTIAYPADADHAFTVGAYGSRHSWTAVDGNSYNSATADQTVPAYSSRGPRIDGVAKPDISAPGSIIISLRDHDIFTSSTMFCVDNGTFGGPSNYYIMEGTSMAAPICTGAAALLYQHSPAATPAQIYTALRTNADVDGTTGAVPNTSWGYGKLNVNTAVKSIPLPVELTSFTSAVHGGAVTLSWRTATETSNYGFDIEKKEAAVSSTTTAQNEWTKIAFVPGNGTSNVQHEYAFVDKPSRSGVVSYRLKQIDRDGKFTYSAVVEAAASAGPVQYALDQNYPNPFNPSTTMQFSVASAGRVHLAVYDILGREVAVLADSQMEPGQYHVEWNASTVPSGVYFYRLDAGSFSAVKKLLLQK